MGISWDNMAVSDKVSVSTSKDGLRAFLTFASENSKGKGTRIVIDVDALEIVLSSVHEIAEQTIAEVKKANEPQLRYCGTATKRRAAAKAASKYAQSKKGKAAMTKYAQSKKGKATRAKAIAKYQGTEKGKAAAVRYAKSDKGKTAIARANKAKGARRKGIITK